jgi:hypothetical protein
MRSIFFAYAWLLLSAGVILVSVGTLQASRFISLSLFDFHALSQIAEGVKKEERAPILAPAEKLATVESTTGIGSVLGAEDARSLIISRFLERHNSPLKPYDHFGQVFVGVADRYGFDFRLLPAIAMQESNLCKNIPENSYNCLGFGIHERGTLTFENYEANFERAGRELKANYIDQGRTTPDTIMKKYTPSSDGSWADSVNQWMAEMRYDDRAAGKANRADANVLEFATSASQSGLTKSSAP